ncbi:MAG: AAA family ATPase [Nitrospiraceae bacterium]
MELKGFHVTNYRNVPDSGWIDTNQITAFVGQNEAGKSNLFEALYRLNPIIAEDSYIVDEDWPVDNWQERRDANGKTVCTAEFMLDKTETVDLYKTTLKKSEPPQPEASSPSTEQPPPLPANVTLRVSRSYGSSVTFSVPDPFGNNLDPTLISQWAKDKIPKFVYVTNYGFSGTQTELDQLLQRWDKVGRKNRHKLSREDQTILIILDLSNIDIEDFHTKGQTSEGRTIRSFDKRAASAFLSKEFANIWRQKSVEFDIEIDGNTLNIFARDTAIGMPVRLHRRSTGFRWHVSFAWQFTHASKGQYNNCILLLEEPGIHLHYSGQRDLLEVFENLSQNNTILYTTHLASMVDLAHPERVRIVETRDHHAHVVKGIVSAQKGPMAVIEMSLGLTGDMSGLLGNRQTLIVEGGDDALILHKLSAILKADAKDCLSDRIYLWPSRGAPHTPMYAAFAIGQKWEAGVLLDSDAAGNEAKKKIDELYLAKLSEQEQKRFRVLMLGKTAGIRKTDASIEDIFPDEFYLSCVNDAFGLSIKMADLPVDGSDMITKRVEAVLQSRYGKEKLDKRLVFAELLNRFDKWEKSSDLPKGTVENAAKLFKAINRSFIPETP